MAGQRTVAESRPNKSDLGVGAGPAADVADLLLAGARSTASSPAARRRPPRSGAALPCSRSALKSGPARSRSRPPTPRRTCRTGSRRGSSASPRLVASVMMRGPAGEVAVLGGVGDRVAHAGDALLVHEVDDQLHLVEALEVGHLRLVAGLDQRLEAGLHERGEAAAQHDLLAEQVGLGLLGERRLDHAGAGAADGVGVATAPAPWPCRWRPGATAMRHGTPPPSV